MTSEQFHQTDSRDIVLYPSKGKLLLGSAFRLALVIIGIGIIYIGIIYIGYHQRTISLGIFAMAFGILASGIFTVAFGCLGLIYALYRLFASAPVLVINNEGIKSSLMGVTQMVKWEEIDAIYPRRIGTDTWFEVTLSAKGALRSRLSDTVHPGGFTRPGSRVIIIPQSLLPFSVKQLIEEIQKRYRMYIEKYNIIIRP